MKLSITTRLTITSAVLTALVFVPATIALYLGVSAAVESENARSTESVARNLAFMAISQWDEDLMVEYKIGLSPLETVSLAVPDWALVRGDGSMVRSAGIFARDDVRKATSESFLAEIDGSTYRVASVPLFSSAPEHIDSLPEPVRAVIERESPDGVYMRARREFLRYRRDPTRGEPALEVALIEDGRIVELTVLVDGRLVQREEEALEGTVPQDLAEMLGREIGLGDPTFASWTASNGQLIAMISGEREHEGACRVAVNRLGERFVPVDENDDGALRVDPASRLWILTATDAAAELGARRRLLASLVSGATIAWAAVVLVGWYVTRRALSPVKRIVESVEAIELSRLAQRLPVGEVRDELSRIAATINRMLDRIESGYRRERRFTGDASHELRGPLAKVIADIDVALAHDRDAAEYHEVLTRCRSYARAMQRLIESLLWLARLDSRRAQVRVRPFELTDLVTEVVRVFPEDEASRVRLELEDGGSAVNVLGDPDLIGVMLQNLLQNALRYSPDGEPVEIRIGPAGDRATISVHDRGQGIPDDQIPHVFSRFYRVDRSRSRDSGGFGLGLAIVDEIAGAHGFRVSLENAASGGFTATFSLPSAP